MVSLRQQPLLLVALCALSLGLCPGCPEPVPPGDGDGNGTALVSLKVFASNTNGAAGIAVRESDGGVFIVGDDGLFGPIESGDDVSQLTPIGATNLLSADIYDSDQSDYSLAIAGNGEFWIASSCCGTLGVVPAAGGDAEPFTGLIDGNPPTNIFPDALVVVPSNANFSGFDAGDILAGEDTSFSRLAAIDPATRTVTSIANPSTTNRHANALAFDAAGNLFTARAGTALTSAGLQQIDSDGAPTAVDGTLGLAANDMVVLANGDILIRGTLALTGGSSFRGLLILDATSGELLEALEISASDASSSDDLVLLPDGTVLMTQPNLNRVVTVNFLR